MVFYKDFGLDYWYNPEDKKTTKEEREEILHAIENELLLSSIKFIIE